MTLNTDSIVCLAGKNEIAIHGLRLLLEKVDKKRVFILCNSTDNGFDTWQPSLLKVAKDLELKIINLDECYNIPNLIFISLEFDKLIQPNKFSTTRLYNIHFSYLPAYKGMYTSALPLINGETESGVTLHKIDSGIDTGDIIDQIKFEIDANDNARSLYNKYLSNSKKLVEKNLERILDGDVKASQQASKGSSYFSKKAVDYQNLQINLNGTAEQIRNQIRGYTFPEYQVPKIHNCCINFSEISQEKSKSKAGSIVLMDRTKLQISTIDYDLILFRDKDEELFVAAKENNLDSALECIDSGANLNKQNGKGWTPLIVASFNGSVSIVDLLIESGADLNLSNYKGTTPLMYAMSCYERTGKRAAFDLLLKSGAQLDRVDFFGKSIKDYAAERSVIGLLGIDN